VKKLINRYAEMKTRRRQEKKASEKKSSGKHKPFKISAGRSNLGKRLSKGKVQWSCKSVEKTK